MSLLFQRRLTSEILCEDADRSFLRMATFLSANFNRLFCEIRTMERPAHPAPECVRIAAHSSLTRWTTGENVCFRNTVFVEEFFESIRA